MTRYWLNWYPILMQVNRECFTNYFHSSKETQISTNLQILDRFPPVSRPVTCSNDPSALQKSPPSPRKQLFIDLRKIDRFLFFPSLSFFPTLWRAPLHIGRVSRWQSGEIDAVGCQGSPLEGDRFSYQRFHLVFVFHRHTPSMIRVKPPFHLRDPLDPHCKPSNYGKHFCNVL